MSEMPRKIGLPDGMLERQREVLVAHVAEAPRRRVRRRATVAAAAVVVLAALVAAPAVGLASRIGELFEGTPAPPQIEEVFVMTDDVRNRFREARAQDPYSRIVVEEARGVASVQATGALVRLWVALTEDGRQCSVIEVELAPGGRVFGPGTGCDPLNADGSSLAVWWAAAPHGIVHVRVHADEAVRVDVHTEDGSVKRLPVVAGHALGAIDVGARMSLVVARDADGDEVARFPSP
jgi:hypothetical protein